MSLIKELNEMAGEEQAPKKGTKKFTGPTYPIKVAGIDCLAGVTYYAPHRHSINRDEQDDLEELEFVILDRKGYRAQWLEKKVSDAQEEAIRASILKQIMQRQSKEED